MQRSKCILGFVIWGTALIISGCGGTGVPDDVRGLFGSTSTDPFAPQLSLLGSSEIQLEVGSPYIEPKYSALSLTEGDLTDRVTVTGTVNTNSLGRYTLLYSVTDSAGRTATAERVILVVDTTAPIITLFGLNDLTHERTFPYLDEGAKVSDNYDASVSLRVLGEVNVYQVGEYQIRFEASDSSGNRAEGMVRVVRVTDTIAPVVAITSPAEGTEIGGVFALTGTCESGLSVVLSRDVAQVSYGGELRPDRSVPCMNGNFSADITLTAGTGNKVVRATQTDQGQNVGFSERTFGTDSTPPTIAVASLQPTPSPVNQNQNAVYALQFVGATSILLNDATKSTYLSLDRNPNPGVNCTIESVSSVGSYRNVTLSNCMGDGTVRLRIAAGAAVDNAGNELAETLAGVLVVDNTPPAILGTLNRSQTICDPSLVNLNDGLSSPDVLQAPISCTGSVDFRKAATYNGISCSARDLAGNLSTVSREFQIMIWNFGGTTFNQGVKSVSDLRTIGTSPASLSATVDTVLCSNLELGSGYQPSSSSFGAIFEGQGHKIYNTSDQTIAIDQPGGNQIGIFSRTTGSAEIRNLKLENLVIRGRDNVGTLVGLNRGKILRISVVGGSVEGNSRVGGLVGQNGDNSADGRIENSYCTNQVSGSSSVGGLVGRNDQESEVSYSYSLSSNLIGSADSDSFVFRSYFLNPSAGSVNESLYGSPRTQAELQTTSNYVGWDFFDAAMNANGIWLAPVLATSFPSLRGH